MSRRRVQPPPQEEDKEYQQPPARPPQAQLRQQRDQNDQNTKERPNYDLTTCIQMLNNFTFPVYLPNKDNSPVVGQIDRPGGDDSSDDKGGSLGLGWFAYIDRTSDPNRRFALMYYDPRNNFVFHHVFDLKSEETTFEDGLNPRRRVTLPQFFNAFIATAIEIGLQLDRLANSSAGHITMLDEEIANQPFPTLLLGALFDTTSKQTATAQMCNSLNSRAAMVLDLFNSKLFGKDGAQSQEKPPIFMRTKFQIETTMMQNRGKNHFQHPFKNNTSFDITFQIITTVPFDNMVGQQIEPVKQQPQLMLTPLVSSSDTRLPALIPSLLSLPNEPISQMGLALINQQSIMSMIQFAQKFSNNDTIVLSGVKNQQNQAQNAPQNQHNQAQNEAHNNTISQMRDDNEALKIQLADSKTRCESSENENKRLKREKDELDQQLQQLRQVEQQLKQQIADLERINQQNQNLNNNQYNDYNDNYNDHNDGGLGSQEQHDGRGSTLSRAKTAKKKQGPQLTWNQKLNLKAKKKRGESSSEEEAF